MAVRQLRKEPALPPARLFLDDIQEIGQILTDAYLVLPESPDFTFVYTVNGVMECTSLKELEEHGGVAKKFEMKIRSNSRDFPVLTTDWRMSLRVPYDLAETPAAAAITAKLRSIIEDRRVFFPAFINDLGDQPYT